MILTHIDARGVARLTLNRPDRHNAFDDLLIGEIHDTLLAWSQDKSVRAVILAAEGKSFSAGADLNWMKRMAGYSEDQNLADARNLAQMVRQLDRMPVPTIARIQGPAYGGGVGLVAACDIAVAVPEAKFALTEVKLGLIPAVISPFVIRAVGARAARRYFLTGEAFDAPLACQLGLIHQLASHDQIDAEIEKILTMILANGPLAMKEAKYLVEDVADASMSASLMDEMARRIAAMRTSEEGQEGVKAFLEKRPPKWQGRG